MTGASDGIGLAYSRVLARLGFNIILLSRNKQRLEAAKALVEAENSQVKVEIVVQDLGELKGYEEYEEALGRRLKGVRVGLLVLNAGLG